ncbi:Major allergen Pru ar like [Actinidia chinensis var. chinensis]|uniref:Major allergen Pru ar like n=1 Tax=Actinidia chinensis var. chinensis TaxID=1590841 RepID=A0A2R6PW75_ACTCC|nr:Major allergen Pru ar like [Actinidia chinensis var. chinensis]
MSPSALLSILAIFIFTEDMTSPIPASRIFKAMVLDGDNLIPKIVPQDIKSIEIIQGDGGPGSIKLMKFPEGYPYTYVKLRVDILDKENMIYAYVLIEGDALSDKIESVSNEMKLEPSLDGGCIGKFTSKYHAKEGADISEEDIKAGKHWCADLFKVVEAYLLANPDAYV